MTANTEGTRYLKLVTEKLKNRLEELNQRIAEGQKDIESMHEYYWENYAEMDQYGYEDTADIEAVYSRDMIEEQMIQERVISLIVENAVIS